MYAGRYIPPSKKESSTSASSDPSTAGVLTTSAAVPYARYVPAPKTKDDPPTPISAGTGPKKIVSNVDHISAKSPKSGSANANHTSQHADGSPKKRKRDAENGDEDGKERKKEKKSKKSRPVTDEDASAQAANSEQLDEQRLDDEAPNNEASEAKPKKDKKKKRRLSMDQAGGDADRSIMIEQAGSDVDEDDKPKRDKKKKKRKQAEEAPEDETTDKIKKQHKSVLERKEKALKKAKKLKPEPETEGEAKPDTETILPKPDELHGLEPLPQPEPVVFDQHRAGYETLPPWLANPIRVQPKTKASWTDLGIGAEAAKVLAAKGFKEAFAVQTAAIPLLLPSLDRQGDIVVSAATGSGKTLAYVLPMVRDISQGIVTKLRGLIVVPTRELVRQAQEACETCASAFAHRGNKRVKIGISMGSMAFKQEQAALMEEEQRYDPDGYAKYLERRDRILDMDDSDEDDGDDIKPPGQSLSSTKPLPDHVIEHVSKVDILICTPGRLVEHINQTPGFTLDYVRWLVVDEADKLLAQSFQQWLDVVMDKLSVDKPGARDFSHSNKSGVRKVILSATMTRDLSLLNGLKLRRPKLIALEGTGTDEHDRSSGPEGEHVLPDTLSESVIKVRDPNLKPLYLLDLLNSKYMVPMNTDGARHDTREEQKHSREASDSSSSESDADSDSDADYSSGSESDTESKPVSKLNTTLLVFTKSNESALRLLRLLAILSPSLSSLIGVLTSTTRTATRRRTLAAFAKGKIRILVASDLVARGIDLPELEHVVNYDIPASAAAYVHRVGRTARAGRKGAAWTLVGNTEAAWFFREIGGEGKGEHRIQRSSKVERVRVGDQGDDGFGEERVKEYELALEQLGKEAGEMRRRR
ncbi:ATP-dependent RNA helicase dbp6 [Coniochaeta pulveracea]|uniref:ATP-dependent RNA helicase n=1 Tax=Coniochaeta pulveracea TaxID=177199 RepID=A0A420YGM2_9PEZI|nr:ATP-dependent RNA helicase dbp6 [Coniochaeta pulveracea]